MKITFENLGALEYGEIELADLTILCGENNTGKTYVTYLIYCILSTWKNFASIDLKKEFSDLRKNGITTIDLENRFQFQWDEICSITVNKFERDFYEMLAAKSDLFDQLKIKLNISLGETWKERTFKHELRSNKGNLLVTMVKDSGSSKMELAAPKSGEITRSIVPLEEFIEERLFGFMLQDIIPDVFIASTERTGATTFKKQLNLATSNLIDLLSQAHKEGADSITPRKLFETMYSRPEYALPIRHNVQFLNQLPTTSAEDGPFFKEFPEILAQLEGIVGGTYVTNKEGNTHFQPKGSTLKLSLGEVSSSVRSLLIVWYWIKYNAEKGDLLMLDEPELNLHPENQRKLARFIASLINKGIKVFITTHSDYIIREFNTLIMLNQDPSKLGKIFDDFKSYSINDKLAATRVALYITGEETILKPGAKRKSKVKTLLRANINDMGIEATTFDTTADDMNAIQEAIYYAIH